MEKINWFEVLVKRLGSETPSFFKKIIYFGIGLGALGGGLLGLESQGIQLPVWLIGQADNLIIIGSVSALIAKATVKNPEELAK